MNFIDFANLGPNHQKFYRIVDDFCQTNLKNNDIKNLWPKLGEMELLGITADKNIGGLELDLSYQLIAMTLISSYSPSIGLSYGAHSNLCLHQLNKYGNINQKQKFLPKLISGEHIGALAMSEVSAGSDALNLKLSAKALNDDFILNGSKMWITNGPIADVVIVYAKTGEKISAFIVDKTCPNWYPAQTITKLGMRDSPTSELVFNNCRVPKQNLLGELDKGLYILMDGLNTERLILTGGPIGIMQASIKLMQNYMQMRQQFNQPIANFQLMQAKIADCYTKYAACSAWALNLSQASSINRFDASALILFASEAASKVASEAVQTLGGNGYSEDYQAASLYRDAKLYEIGAGTNEIRRTIVGKYLLDKKYAK